jgi:hypothetical protein
MYQIVMGSVIQAELRGGGYIPLPTELLRELRTRDHAALRLAHHLLSHQPLPRTTPRPGKSGGRRWWRSLPPIRVTTPTAIPAGGVQNSGLW